MTEREQAALNEQGYVILEGFMSESFLESLRIRVEQLFEEEGKNAGSEFKQEPQTRRLANLVDKGEVFRKAISNPVMLEYVRHVLGPDFKLSSLNARSANPHSNWTQPLHVDGGLLPDDKGPLVCNTVWILDEFTEHNGALRLVPGTHRTGRRPQEALEDPAAAHQEILVTAPAGTLVVMNAHLWHGGTANATAAPRRAMHGFFCRGDVAQQQYQKKLLRSETQAALSAEERRLLALDDPRNDALATVETGRSGFMK